MSETFGERLRRLRAEKGLSQRQLSAVASKEMPTGRALSYAFISRLEAGSRQPSIHIIRGLAIVFNVSPHWLETGEEDDVGAGIVRARRDLQGIIEDVEDVILARRLGRVSMDLKKLL